MPHEPEPRIVINGVFWSDAQSDNLDCDVEDVFGKYRQWVQLHDERFHNNANRIDGLKYIVSAMALQWYNAIPTANVPANLNELQDAFYEKFIVRKTWAEWTKELQKCKYTPGSRSLPVINRFHVIYNKLGWPIGVQIETFVKILPMNLRQFVINIPGDDRDWYSLSHV